MGQCYTHVVRAIMRQLHVFQQQDCSTHENVRRLNGCVAAHVNKGVSQFMDKTVAMFKCNKVKHTVELHNLLLKCSVMKN